MIKFSIPDYNETIIKKNFKHVVKLCSVRNGLSVSTAVNDRGEGTVIAVRTYLCRCNSFPLYDCIPQNAVIFLFQTITGAQVRFFFSIFTTLFLTFFLLLVYGLAFPHFFTAQQVTKAAVFNVRVG